METMQQRWIKCLAALSLLPMWLASCQTPPTDAGTSAGGRPAPAATGTTPARPPPSTPTVIAEPTLTPALPSGTAQRHVTNALELLETGKEDEANAELQRALALEPGHRLALSLQRQISADPQATLGRESFTYRVQPGETLSRIAQRFLGDVHQFYILARYNDIKVPRQLAGGQAIRVPGKAPPAGATAVTPAAAPAPAVTPTPRASIPSDATQVEREQAERAERERKQAIANATRAARQAFARQDLNAAIAQWDRVLELEPGNATAKLERQRAIDLKEKLGRMK